MNTGMPFQLQEYVVGKACWDDVMSFGKDVRGGLGEGGVGF
jgi:hypothetical protein